MFQRRPEHFRKLPELVYSLSRKVLPSPVMTPKSIFENESREFVPKLLGASREAPSIMLAEFIKERIKHPNITVLRPGQRPLLQCLPLERPYKVA